MNIEQYLKARELHFKDVHNWTGTYRLKERSHSDFDKLRQMEIEARIAYNNILVLIGEESNRLEEKFTAKRLAMRNDCEYTYTLEKTISKSGSTIYTVIGTPEYVMEGDEEWYKVNRYIPFFIIMGVLVFIEKGGYGWKDLESGKIIADNDIMLLQQDIIPQFFLDRVQRKVALAPKILSHVDLIPRERKH